MNNWPGGFPPPPAAANDRDAMTTETARPARPSPAAPGAPAFVLGAPRSGTSLVYKLLCLHPDAAWLSNYVRRVPSLGWLGALNRVAARRPARRRAVWFGADGGDAYAYGRSRSAGERAFPQPVEGEPVFAHHGIPDDPGLGAAPGAAAGLARTFEQVRRSAGGRVLVNKRIANNGRVGVLVAAFPAARFVRVTRDGRAVAASLAAVDWWPDSRVWWYGGTPRLWEADGGAPLALCAEHWVREVDLLERELATHRVEVLDVRYEELVTDPLGTVARVAAHAGLDPDDRRWRADVSSVRFPDRTDGWRRRLAAGDVELVEDIQGPTLAQLGYR